MVIDIFSQWRLLILIGALVIIVYIWFRSLVIREAVIEYCKRVCTDTGLQFLDDSVALGSLSIERGRRGVLYLVRVYHLEISAQGTERRGAYVTVVGRRIMSFHYCGPDGKVILDQNTPMMS